MAKLAQLIVALVIASLFLTVGLISLHPAAAWAGDEITFDENGVTPAPDQGLTFNDPENSIDPDNPPLMDLNILDSDNGLPIQQPTAAAARRLPRQVNLSLWADPSGNQGKVGSCVAWALGYGLGGWWANRLGRKKRFDPDGKMAIFNRGTKSNFWLNPMSIYAPIVKGKNIGVSVNQANYYASNFGIAPSYAYSVGQMGYAHQPNLKELAAASRFRLKGLRRLFHAGSNQGSGAGGIHLLKQELAKGRPVILGFRTTRRLGRYQGGVYSQPSCSTGAIKCGAHMLTALGYNSRGLLVQNSWGYGWGDRGFAVIDWDTVASDVPDAFSAKGMKG